MKSIAALAQRYPDKRVLITGATSGLGEALALRFAQAGFRVGITGRNEDKIRRTVEQVEAAGGEALAVQLEITRLEDFEAAVKQIQENWSGLDILVNNAGVATAGKLSEFSLESWRDVIDTDLWSVIHGCRLFAPVLARSGGGHIVNVSSAAGLLCAPEMAGYNVAKAGVVALSETLRVELSGDNIDVSVCCPTIFKSGLLDDRAQGDESFSGVTADGLRDTMQKTRFTSDDIAADLLRVMSRRKLYCVTMPDARIMWRLTRYFPELYRSLVKQLYLRKIWIFNPDHH